MTDTPKENTNPLLDRVKLPGMTFQLPSKGLFYKNNELADSVQSGEVYVAPMSALDEMTMRSPDKLLSGDAIVEIFENCIPDVIKPKQLLQKDVDFLVTCLKRISYGNETEIHYTHDCIDADQHSYVINLDKFINESKQIDPTSINKDYSVTLENDQVVMLHPITFADVMELSLITSQDDISDKEEQERTIKTIVNVIDSVDGITDKDMIDEWIRKIPAGWAKDVSRAIQNSSQWGPDFLVEIKCKDCGGTVKLENQLNPITFFLT